MSEREESARRFADRTEREDALIAALLRAAFWLDEVGAALALMSPAPDKGTLTTRSILLEAGYARDVALDAMVAQNRENIAKLDAA